jgi:hypothetical protein
VVPSYIGRCLLLDLLEQLYVDAVLEPGERLIVEKRRWGINGICSGHGKRAATTAEEATPPPRI